MHALGAKPMPLAQVIGFYFGLTNPHGRTGALAALSAALSTGGERKTHRRAHMTNPVRGKGSGHGMALDIQHRATRHEHRRHEHRRHDPRPDPEDSRVNSMAVPIENAARPNRNDGTGRQDAGLQNTAKRLISEIYSSIFI
jgi:hypothetical protein